MKRLVDIGILQSRSGAYAALSQTSRLGALQGVAEVNADPGLDLAFRVTERDPEGRLDRYAPLCRDILSRSDVQHIFGCVTSASRKEVIPELERFGGVLWYPVPYEGFEASEHVAYMHSCPNQHLLPLLDWALPALGRSAYLVGSNYIWGWEMAQIARAEISAASGRILGDRYLPVGETELDHILHEVRALRPDFILNSLIGESSYAFLARLRAGAGPEATTPVLSCNFTESELLAAGPAAEGLIAAGPWFEPGTARGGSFAEMARQSVHELARLLHGRPGAETLPLAELLRLARQGGLEPRLHPDHFHARQPVVIARLQDGRFRELQRLPAREADPYLTRRDGQRPALALKVVS
ncbi:transporter substrate-binding protein [Paracoccus aminophilus]|uniref:Negative amidase regulator, AmiC n=1 Tax=Paracoccus aminophilus JCM 7686 TaxID=1367847 RepID=S5YTN0_PARAH|nr:transporter substrate-binding protein [Paracoccus aminophilus]AGT08556.1 negative amidase regulator, AmiC [Paracoccus aminophilus JCM 7686]